MRRPCGTVAVLCLAMFTGAQAHAQTREAYPSRPVRIIVPMAAGGGSDSMARLSAQRLSERLGQQFVVDNRGGGGGLVGIALAVSAAPDGYTLMLISGSFPATIVTHRPANDPINNLAPIAKIGYSPFFLAVHPSVPAKNPKELIDYARSRPGQLSYLVPGTGSLTHLVTEAFAQRSGTKMVYVPYKSTGLGMPDLINGQTQLILGGLLPILPHVQQGRLRGLAVTTAKRWYAVPDIPTLSETLPGFEAESWFGLVVPKRTPQDIVTRLNEGVNQMLNEPETKKTLDALGVASAGGEPAQLAAAIRSEHARALKVVKDANIRSE